MTATKDLQINNLPCVVHTRIEPKVPPPVPGLELQMVRFPLLQLQYILEI
jgi:hypothetical protein